MFLDLTPTPIKLVYLGMELVTKKLPWRVQYEQFKRESKIMGWNLSQEFG